MRRLASTGSSPSSSCSLAAEGGGLPSGVERTRELIDEDEESVALAVALFSIAIRCMAPGCETSREPAAAHRADAVASSESRFAVAGEKGSVCEPLLPAVVEALADEGREPTGGESGAAVRLDGRAAKRRPEPRAGCCCCCAIDSAARVSGEEMADASADLKSSRLVKKTIILIQCYKLIILIKYSVIITIRVCIHIKTMTICLQVFLGSLLSESLKRLAKSGALIEVFFCSEMKSL